MGISKKRRILAEELPIDPDETMDDNGGEPILIHKRESASLPNRPKRRGVFMHRFSTVVLLMIAAWVLSDYYKVKQELTLLKDPTAQARYIEARNQKIISEISRHILVSENETPKIVAVKDMMHLSPSVYSNVVDGDVAIVYEQAKEVIIWSPSRHKVIAIEPYITETPVTTSSTTTPKSASSSASSAGSSSSN